MPFTIKESEIPAGTYTGMLEAVTIKHDVPAYKTGKPTDMNEWQFQINVNGELKPISSLSTMQTGPGSKTRKWLEALLRRPLVVGETIDDPVGQNALIVVGVNAKGYPTITDVLPAPQVEQTTLPDGSSVPR